jgi:hypothetical protein
VTGVRFKAYLYFAQAISNAVFFGSLPYNALPLELAHPRLGGGQGLGGVMQA